MADLTNSFRVGSSSSRFHLSGDEEILPPTEKWCILIESNKLAITRAEEQSDFGPATGRLVRWQATNPAVERTQ